MQLNASRIKVLQAQDDLVNSMKESASKELLRVSHDSSSYEHLLKNLIVQVLNATVESPTPLLTSLILIAGKCTKLKFKLNNK